MATVDIDDSRLQADSQPKLVGFGSCLAQSLHSLYELTQLLQ